MTDDKDDFDSLDLSDLGEPPKATEPPVVTEEPKEPGKVESGYWIFGKPITEVSQEEFLDWIQEKIPGSQVEGFNKQVFNTVQDKQKQVDRIISLYASCRFPRKNNLI